METIFAKLAIAEAPQNKFQNFFGDVWHNISPIRFKVSR